MAQVTPTKTRVFELNGVLQNFSRKDKGSKNCKDPHTSFTVLTRLMKPEELDAILHGTIYGICTKIRIEVIIDEQPTIERVT